jgi:hypothetical protein
MRPRDDDPGYRIVARDPSGEDDIALIYQGYDADYLPGLWVPYGGYSYGGRWFGDAGGSRHLRRGPGIEPGRAPTDRIVAIPRGSSAPFSDGGIASPGISNFSPKAARGGIASPAISNFSPRAVRGGGVRVGGGVRAGGGGARAGSIGR